MKTLDSDSKKTTELRKQLEQAQGRLVNAGRDVNNALDRLKESVADDLGLVAGVTRFRDETGKVFVFRRISRMDHWQPQPELVGSRVLKNGSIGQQVAVWRKWEVIPDGDEADGEVG